MQIVEMAQLAAQGKPRLTDFPLASRPATPGLNPLSDSEEEEESAVLGDAPESGGRSSDAALATAIAKLTEISAHLTKQKKKDGSLDALLDAGSAGPGEGSSVPAARKYAAALRALRRTLTKHPEELYKAIERNMSEDFQMQAQLPGAQAVPVSARAWLELRSRVQGFATPVRMLWGVAGILDALRAGSHAEARARACLLLAQGDQLSIDRGSWLVASELSLEESPPMASFTAHTLPMDSEALYSRLIDGRWFDLVPAEAAGLRLFDGEEEEAEWATRKCQRISPRRSQGGAQEEAQREIPRKRKIRRWWQPRGRRASSGSRLSEPSMNSSLQPGVEPLLRPLPSSTSTAQAPRGTASFGRGSNLGNRAGEHDAAPPLNVVGANPMHGGGSESQEDVPLETQQPC